MRVLAFLFGLYLLLLSTLSCGDNEERYILLSQEAAVAENVHDHDHSEMPETCSPFCLCSCCGTVNAGAPSFQLPDFTFIPYSNQAPLSYRSLFADTYFAHIWQPPKIV